MSKGLYIHIPFCVKKCNYCDFLSAPADRDTIKAYVDELLEEIKYKSFAFENLYDEDSNDLDTIFIGGGTPSILDGEDILRIMKCVDRNFYIMPGAEITMEVNPGTLCNNAGNMKDNLQNNLKEKEEGLLQDYNENENEKSKNQDDNISFCSEKSAREKIRAWKAAGINRISIGLQSTDNEELKCLGRIHTYETFLENYKLLREENFENINVDLISAIPGQSLETWKKSLETVCKLGPEHISAYSLIVEEGTPFYKIYGEDLARRDAGEEPRLLPTEETERAMYQATARILEGYGYKRYEISNYAKPGYECKHNLRYWERKDYIGVGLGASSLIDNKRYKNLIDLRDYMGMFTEELYLQYISMYEEMEELDTKAQMEEFMFLGLRKTAGISPKEFDACFGQGMFKAKYLDLVESFAKKELMEECPNGNWKLTDKGVDVSNIVLADMLLD